MLSYAGQVVIVTGAVGRLGCVTARTLAPLGARLVLVDRSEQRLRAAYPDLALASDHLLAGDIDLLAAEAAGRVAALALGRFQRIDALVHTVGAFAGGTKVYEGDLQLWTRLFDTNVRTTLHICQAVLPTMLKQRRGRVVTVASRAALAGPAGAGAYAAAKSAVLRLTESLSAEVKDAGVNVNCVLPGTLDTPENRRAMPDADPRTWVPLQAVANVIAFLASDAAGAIHGAALPAFGTA